MQESLSSDFKNQSKKRLHPTITDAANLQPANLQPANIK